MTTAETAPTGPSAGNGPPALMMAGHNTKQEVFMNTFYCVTSSFYDNGRVTAAITATKQAARRPESEFHSTSRADIYIDWYDTQQAAEQAIQDARNA